VVGGTLGLFLKKNAAVADPDNVVYKFKSYDQVSMAHFSRTQKSRASVSDGIVYQRSL
jgi:hypothetical protein